MPSPIGLKKWLLSSTVAGMVLVGPVTAHAAFGEQTLKLGMKHDDVKELQDLLKRKGYFTYKESTAYFGPITRDAVVRFQRDSRLAADGIVGPNTFKALGVTDVKDNAKTPSSSGSTMTYSSPPRS
mgnify:CR=1 FL=1